MVFYAFCGINYEDAVAIDNIRSQTTSETTTPEPTTPEPTTPEPTTPEPTTPEPTTPEPTTPEPTTPEPTTPEPTTPEPRYWQDYSPCSCSVDSNKISVTCDGVSVETVHDVFQRVNDPEIYELSWTYPLPDDETLTFSLPKDFLGNTSVTGKIFIQCSSTNRLNLLIDPLAFRSSQNSLIDLYIYYFDFGLQKDMNFLSVFDKLEGLYFVNITNFTAFQYLPPLPSLQGLYVGACPELKQISLPDFSQNKLKELDLRGNEINDEMADEIVAKLAASNSADSLEFLSFYGNYVTRIPSQVGSDFPKLKTVFFPNNKISHIPSSSLNYVYPLESLILAENKINTIESGAFGGKSTAARTAIYLLFFEL